MNECRIKDVISRVGGVISLTDSRKDNGYRNETVGGDHGHRAGKLACRPTSQA